MSRTAFHLGRRGLPTVFRHRSGAELSIGDASSVDGLARWESGSMCVVDVKQEPRGNHPHELISFPMLDDGVAMPDVAEFAHLLGRIDRRLKAGRDTHVVCAMGQSRSAAVVTNYVAAALQIEFREALALVRYAYPQANPNPGFRDWSHQHRSDLSVNVEPVPVDDTLLEKWHDNHQPAWLPATA